MKNEKLSADEIYLVNCALAREFIETRLEVEPTSEKIRWFANRISEIEAMKRGNTP